VFGCFGQVKVQQHVAELHEAAHLQQQQQQHAAAEQAPSQQKRLHSQ
jgi:hypothetical protein